MRHDPTGLAVGNDKTLFVTEAYGRRLLELDLASGRVVLVAGTGVETLPEPGQTAGDGGPASTASFGLALGAAVDGQGNVYVADFFNDAIRMIDQPHRCDLDGRRADPHVTAAAGTLLLSGATAGRIDRPRPRCHGDRRRVGALRWCLTVK